MTQRKWPMREETGPEEEEDVFERRASAVDGEALEGEVGRSESILQWERY